MCHVNNQQLRIGSTAINLQSLLSSEQSPQSFMLLHFLSMKIQNWGFPHLKISLLGRLFGRSPGMSESALNASFTAKITNMAEMSGGEGLVQSCVLHVILFSSALSGQSEMPLHSSEGWIQVTLSPHRNPDVFMAVLQSRIAEDVHEGVKLDLDLHSN